MLYLSAKDFGVNNDGFGKSDNRECDEQCERRSGDRFPGIPRRPESALALSFSVRASVIAFRRAQVAWFHAAGIYDQLLEHNAGIDHPDF